MVVLGCRIGCNDNDNQCTESFGFGAAADNCSRLEFPALFEWMTLMDWI